MTRRVRTALVAGALGWGLLTGPATATAAQADPVFDPEDAQDLAELLNEATQAQDVCYGWTVHVIDPGTGSGAGYGTAQPGYGTAQQSTGSNFGPGQSLDSAGGPCRYRVEFTASITYTSEYSDAEDYASWAVASRPGGGPDTEDLDRLRLFDEDDLVGDNPDVAVSRAVAALPQLAAEAGVAAPLVAEPASSTPPDVGSLTDHPGSDYLRRAGGLLGFGVILLIGGIAFGWYALRSSRPRLHRVPPPPDFPPPPDSPPPGFPSPPPPPDSPPPDSPPPPPPPPPFPGPPAPQH